MQTPSDPPHRDRLPWRMAVLVFFVFGCLETVAAYLMFNRADDHVYFLDVANRGLAAVPVMNSFFFTFKGQAAGFVFHLIATPSRWLGGHELVHLLWLRIVTLWGFLLAHRWVCHLIEPDDHRQAVDRSRERFMLLCLAYPAQLAWTASLLRDGISCTTFFAALLSFSLGRWVSGLVWLIPTLALRPEFALVLALLMLVKPAGRFLGTRRSRVLVLAGLCALISLAGFGPRSVSSAYAQLVYSEGNVAYPAIAGLLDVKGYLLVLAQGVLDPLTLNAPTSGGVFAALEILFFSWMMVKGFHYLRRSSAIAGALLLETILAMWVFCYFETYVSGFSRHRMALMVIVIAIVSILETRRRRLAAPLES